MLNQLDVKHQVALALFTLLVRETALFLVGIRLNRHRLQCVSTLATVCVRVLVAILAQIVIRAGVAVVALAAQNFTTARHTLLHEFRGITVVQVP